MNEKTKEICFKLAAVLLLISALGYLFMPFYAAFGMAFASAMIAIIRLSSPYIGKNMRRKRLHRMQLIASFLYVAVSVLMFKQRNEWIVCLICAAVFEIYAIFAISSLADKE